MPVFFLRGRRFLWLASVISIFFLGPIGHSKAEQKSIGAPSVSIPSSLEKLNIDLSGIRTSPLSRTRGYQDRMLLAQAPSPAPAPPTGSSPRETWSTEFGEVVHETDIGTWAVWRFGLPADASGAGKIFIDRLGGVQNGRGSYGGYWMLHGGPDQPCSEARSDIEGYTSQNYGVFQITFLDPDAPSRWSAMWGGCDGPPTQSWSGTPVATAPAAQTGRATLGITLQDVTAEISAAAGMSRVVGALVASVTPDGPAAMAGVEAEDVIWAMNGAEIANSRDIAARVAGLSPGNTVDLDLIRNGASLTIRVELVPRVADIPMSSPAGSAAMVAGAGPFFVEEDEIGTIGTLALMRTTPVIRSMFGIDSNVSGLVVTAVLPNSIAATNGLQPGTVVTQVAGSAVADVAAMRAAVEAQYGSGRPSVMLRVSHKKLDATRFVALDISEFGIAAGDLLVEAGIAFDRGGNPLLAAPHLLAAVASGDSNALDMLDNRADSLNVMTREVIQRRLVDAGFYSGVVDGVFGPTTRQALRAFKSASDG